jgi:hypothetical protein
LDARDANASAATARKHEVDANLLARQRHIERVALRGRKQLGELLSNAELRIWEREDWFQ